MFSVTVANNVLNHSPAAKRLAPKLSRVEIDVDYSSLLLPHNPCRFDSQPPTDASAASQDSSTCKGTEENSFSNSADYFSLRLRGGQNLRRHPCNDASGEALQLLRGSSPR